jgi:hypothetical protein
LVAECKNITHANPLNILTLHRELAIFDYSDVSYCGQLKTSSPFPHPVYTDLNVYFLNAQLKDAAIFF